MLPQRGFWTRFGFYICELVYEFVMDKVVGFGGAYSPS
jgi:hypothetical protein